MAGPVAASLGVDVSGVRVHRGGSPATAAQALRARAFAFGNDIVLGPGEAPTDLPLLAHEVAHVVQQRGAPHRQEHSLTGGDSAEREAQQAATAVQRGARFRVTQHRAPGVQRLGISDALDYFADKANNIPGFRMFTVVIGVNPINMRRVERTAANVLRAVVELVPGGGLVRQALDNHGVFERAGTWVEGQLRTLGLTGGLIRDALMAFLDSLGWRDIFRLGDVWDRAKRIFTTPIDRIISFVTGLVSGLVRLVKEAILRPLARLAEGTRGYDLLKAVLGRDPITGEAVPRTAATLIGGFMKLIGQEEVWLDLQRSRAVPRAWVWFQKALSGLLALVRGIPARFVTALRSLEIADVVVLPRAFGKVASVFAGIVGDFLGWAGRQVLGLLQIIFEVVAPRVMPYLRRAAGAFRAVVANPVRFVRTLVRAGIQGFRQFAGRFLGHLRRSLIEWLTGTLAGAGVHIPTSLDLREIVKFVLSVLSLTWDAVRSRLVRVVGERAVTALETGFDLVVTLVRQGPAAAWDKIRESVGNLRDMVMEQIMAFVRSRVVQAAIAQLLRSLNPAGAFIAAITAIYNTVMFFVERLRQIGRVAASFVDSFSAIATGNTGTAANRVETTMAGMLTLVISFLARIAGLGRVSDAVKGIVDRVRAPIMRALDRVVDWIVAQARRLGKLAAGGARRAVATVGGALGLVKRPVRAGAVTHTLGVDPRTGGITIASVEGPLMVKIQRWVKQHQDLRRSRNLPAIDVSGLAAAVGRQVEQATARIRAAQAAAPAVARERLDQLAALVTELLLRIGGGSVEASSSRPDGLGDVKPHGRQTSRHTGGPPERALESEHIIPVRLVSLLFDYLGDAELIVRGRPEDNRQHTVMIYKSAAVSKTRGTEGADHNLINQLKTIAERGTPRLEGRSITARRLRTLPPDVRARISQDFAARAQRLQTTLGEKLPAVFAARIRLTVRSIDQDHKRPGVKEVRGHEQPLPAEDRIRAAAALQAQDIVTIFAERVERGD